MQKEAHGRPGPSLCGRVLLLRSDREPARRDGDPRGPQKRENSNGLAEAAGLQQDGTSAAALLKHTRSCCVITATGFGAALGGRSAGRRSKATGRQAPSPKADGKAGLGMQALQEKVRV